MRFAPDPTHTIAHLRDPHLPARGLRSASAVHTLADPRRTPGQLDGTDDVNDARALTGHLTGPGSPSIGSPFFERVITTLAAPGEAACREAFSSNLSAWTPARSSGAS